MSETQTPEADATAVPEQAAADQGGETATASSSAITDPKRLEELEEAMRDVVDPELGINVVDSVSCTGSPRKRTS